MSVLRGGLVGTGYFSQFHFDGWKRIDGVEISAVADLKIESARAAAAQYGISAAYASLGEMLRHEKLDFVDLVTGPETHLSLTREAMEYKVAIICQKPLAPNLEDAKILVELVKAAKTPFMVHENFRFQPWYREIKSLLDQGVIGESLHSIAVKTRMGDGWQEDAYEERQPYFRTMPRFLIYETGIHFIDTFRFLGGEIDGVYAMLRKLNSAIKGEDSGLVIFEFENGARALWDANRYNESPSENPRFTFGEISVEGNLGSIRVGYDGRSRVKKLGEPEFEHIYPIPTEGFAGDCVFKTQQHFISCLREHREFETNAADYLRSLLVQEAIYESARTGLPIRGIQTQANTGGAER